ncbi:MAG: crossover junction endodeoxyribonuclease RuvC [Spirochaetaceae bacterium]|nr:crossover junction endodeoxyribonuclease RuvC [Spirochaetaceae bacterium]
MFTLTPTSRKALVKNKSKDFISLPGTNFSQRDNSSKNTKEAGASSSGFFIPTKIRRVLGIDPGLASTGYGIVDYSSNRYRMVSYGVISTESNLPHAQRLLAIYTKLIAIIQEFKPQEGAMETLYFAKNVTSAMAVAEARGVATLCLAQNCIPLGEYTPNTIKQSVTGSAGANKATVQEYVRLLLGLEVIPKPDHAADALAAAITHLHSC